MKPVHATEGHANVSESRDQPAPRTDAEAFMLDDGAGEAVMSDFARQLERELAELVEALRRITSDYQDTRAALYHTDGHCPLITEARTLLARVEAK